MSGAAFGSPGISPTWSSSDKDFITTSLGTSRLWATIGHGIVNEVYWPSTGRPQLRDMSFYLVGNQTWRDLKRIRQYHVATPAPYLPAPTVTHTGTDYKLILDILPDPRRDVLLVRYVIEGPYRLIVIVAPHLGSEGTKNHAWDRRRIGLLRTRQCGTLPDGTRTPHLTQLRIRRRVRWLARFEPARHADVFIRIRGRRNGSFDSGRARLQRCFGAWHLRRLGSAHPLWPARRLQKVLTVCEQTSCNLGKIGEAA